MERMRIASSIKTISRIAISKIECGRRLGAVSSKLREGICMGA